jgi:UDP-GlcNAc:undecaprenyl-phosphate GlcNAc-1-phosphate transferase
MPFVVAFFLAFFSSLVFTWLVKKIAWSLKILDYPNEPRKIHQKPIPLLGGLGPFLGFATVLLFFSLATPYILDLSLKLKHILGLLMGGLILIIGGFLDDRYNLKPWQQMIFSFLAILIVIISGIGIREITNPFGGVIQLVNWEKVLFWWHGVGYRLSLPADLFSLLWLLVLIYTTKLLDGLDGLVSGMTVIGTLVIFSLTLFTHWYQPEVGMVSIIGAGAFLGFLIWNWHPAKIFLGTGGSTFAGFLLGTLAIISGGKIATAFLVMGVPFLDMIWVILRRIFLEKKWPTYPDRKHLHFRLLEVGFSQKGAVLFLWSISLFFGTLALFLQSKGKLVAICVLIVFMVCLAIFVSQRNKFLSFKGTNRNLI